MFLLVTHVVSELRKARPHGSVLAWLNAIPESDLFISSIRLGEIQRGIELTREQNPAKALEPNIRALPYLHQIGCPPLRRIDLNRQPALVQQKVTVQAENGHRVMHGSRADQEIRIGALDSIGAADVENLSRRFVNLS